MKIDFDFEYDNQCWNCDGEGKRPSWHDLSVKAINFLDDGSCEVCNGTGREVTDQGNDLLAFLRRHLKPECFTGAK